MAKTHPCMWLVNPAKPKLGSRKSGAVILPTGPAFKAISISTVAFKKIMLFGDVPIDHTYQLAKITAGVVSSAYVRALRKHPNLSDIDGVSPDAVITFEHWYDNYQKAIVDHNSDKPNIPQSKPEVSVVDIKDSMVRNSFAGQALSALIAKHHASFVDKAALSREAFAYADCMMEASK